MPTAVGFALIGAWRGARWLAEARYRARFQALPPEPIERLEADLRRLRAELEDTETRSSLTAKHHRVQALRGAYLDTLAVADLLPLTAWHGLDLATRESQLGEWSGLASEAAAAAIGADEPVLAVELLEAGRSILWAQSLNALAAVQCRERIASCAGLGS